MWLATKAGRLSATEKMDFQEMMDASEREHEIRQIRDTLIEQDLAEIGINLAIDFPDQCISDLMRYPVLSEGGWFIVIKNQRTLQEIYRSPWRLLGPVELLSSRLELN